MALVNLKGFSLTIMVRGAVACRDSFVQTPHGGVPAAETL